MRRVIQFAEMEAHNTNTHVGVKQVLIGILMEGNNEGALRLKTAGFSIDGLRNDYQGPHEP